MTPAPLGNHGLGLMLSEPWLCCDPLGTWLRDVSLPHTGPHLLGGGGDIKDSYSASLGGGKHSLWLACKGVLRPKLTSEGEGFHQLGATWTHSPLRQMALDMLPPDWRKQCQGPIRSYQLLPGSEQEAFRGTMTPLAETPALSLLHPHSFQIPDTQEQLGSLLSPNLGI